MLVLSIALLTGACVSLAFTFDTFRTSDVRVAIGATGSSIAVLILTISSFRGAGFRNLRLPRSVAVHHDPEHGAGLRIPTNGTDVWTTVAAMLGLTTYGTAAAYASYTGLGEALLPFGRDNREGALFMAVCAVCLGTIAVLIASIRFNTTLYICERGIRRHVRRRIFLKKQVFDMFVPWEGVTRVGVGDLGVRGGNTANPVIDLHTTELVPPESKTRHDSEHRLAIMAHQLVVEPNTLFHLLKRLVDNPRDRGLLADAEALGLLRPPPLRERFRAARTQKGFR